MNRIDQDRASHIEALQETLNRLATATTAGSAEEQFDARLALSDVFAERALVAEAVEELDTARQLLQRFADQARLAALTARCATLALLRGDYDRAQELIDGDTEGAQPAGTGPGIPRLWFLSFLLLRDQGRVNDNEVEAVRTKLRSLTGSRAQLLALALDVGFGADGARDTAYADLFPYTGQLAIAPDLGSLGPVDRYLGLIAAGDGRLDDAQRHLEGAIRIADRNGLLPWAARARADLARVLSVRGRADDDELSVNYLAAARATAGQIGLVDYETKSLDPAPRAATPPASVEPSSRPNVFRRDGEYWTVAFAGSTFSLRDTKGLLYLARLLATPDLEIHSLDLVRGGRADETRNDAARVDSVSAGDLTSDPFAGAGEVIDAEAREDYRRRLADLDAEIGQAHDWNDPERVERLNEERDFLVRELAGAVGLGGTLRTVSSASERARISVTKAIWSSVDRITAHGPELGRHLTLSVHTGTFCSYTPDPALKIVWEL